ncbi:MAG TPA: amidohydrolase family protein [Candidatus Deferrimicrobium sp.]|nr:amidohydrolase family protein [Candidatus Deferrimicrobium sp.]
MPQLVIKGARLLDARSEEPIAGDALIVGEDGRIAEIGAATSAVPDGALVIDAAGRTVVPGLIDCHVHLWASHELLHEIIQRSFSEGMAQILRCGRNFLESGVTTVRDAGGTPAGIKRVFARGDFPGPRLQVSVVPLSITGGHGDAQTPAGIDLTGDFPPVEMPSGIADGVDEVRRVVRQQIRAGADWIKVMATGGVYSLMDAPDAVQYTVDEMRVMVEEADKAGLRGVMAHAENARGIKNALRAGIRSIDHGDGLDDEAIELMLEHDVPLVPTFLVIEEMLREDRVESGVTPPWAVEKVHRLLDEIEPRFRRAVERGVRVAMGTDGGLGSHLPTELSLMVEHGLSPLLALRAATIEAARLLRLDGEIGTLEAGKAADVLILDGDPLAEPSLWRDPARIVTVIQAGKVVADRTTT